MTVTYSSKVANASFFTFHRLLLRWRGSIYKLLYREFMVFVVLYSALSLVYRSLANPAPSVSADGIIRPETAQGPVSVLVGRSDHEFHFSDRFGSD